MTFLSGQDDFFQTANQPISVRHLSEPYNKFLYCCYVAQRGDNMGLVTKYLARLKKLNQFYPVPFMSLNE